MRHAFVVALFTLGSLGSLGGARAAGEDALAILKQADAATRAVRGVDYEADVFMEGSELAQNFRVTGRVRGAENPGKEELRLHIEGELAGRNEFWIITDGEQIVSLSKQAKIAIVGKAAEARQLMGLPMVLLMQEYLHPSPFSDEIDGDSQKLEGTKDVAGVECDVVFVVYAEEQGRARWYFGKQDHLPRRVDRLTPDGESARVLLVKNLKVDPKFADDAFAPVVPEGFSKRDYVVPKPPADRPDLLAVGTEAPDWELPKPGGGKVALRDLRGKVVVLDFWATWCGPCKRAMPGVQKIHEHFVDKPVAIIGVNCWERGDAPAYMKEQNFTYGLVLEGDKVAEAYNVRGIPTFYVIGTDGKIVHRASGFRPDLDAQLARIVEGALPAAQDSPKPPAGESARRRL